MISLELPWPPSTNQIWRNVAVKGKPRTLLSKSGRDYRALVARTVLAQRGNKQLAGRVRVDVVAQAPDRRARDLDNILKATLDALTHAGVWQDDSQIDRLLVERGEVCKPGRLLVAIHYEQE
ncbi:RusA family crossover junction endodeoxyribonuclease [Oceanimonas smirnovii]|uniref:RusA family crossover junction endodeoxyribonuclease n=1 Tax=Oceanimonas smirnovii TaxID=264574 RepID=UPI00036A33FE|nr:RusA family crossover junction endodeoxyribonuclease [Oceanimonas smirnovii]